MSIVPVCVSSAQETSVVELLFRTSGDGFCCFFLHVSPLTQCCESGIQSTTLFGDHPFSIKHPQDNFGLQNVNWHPPKCKLTPSKKGLATSNLQFLYRNTQKSPLDSLYFGGRQFAFWRLKLSWGGLQRKGVTPERAVL